MVRSAQREPPRPFFLDTVQRALWEPYRLLFAPCTSVAALEAVAVRAGSARPAGLVLHTSRCGSTLVCRMLGAMPGTPVLSEPAPCDQALRAAVATAGTRARWLQWLLAALGAGGAVVKLDAWSVRERDLLREALPGVPWIFLYPDPTAQGAFADTDVLRRCPALAAAVASLECELLAVRLLRLGPGAKHRRAPRLPAGARRRRGPPPRADYRESGGRFPARRQPGSDARRRGVVSGPQPAPQRREPGGDRPRQPRRGLRGQRLA